MLATFKKYILYKKDTSNNIEWVLIIAISLSFNVEYVGASRFYLLKHRH